MFYDNLKRLCATQGISPTRALINADIPSSRTSNYRDGAIPKQNQLERLAKVLHCSVMDFFWTEEDAAAYEQQKNDITASKLTDDEVDILAVFRKLDRKEQHQFMSMVYRFDTN